VFLLDSTTRRHHQSNAKKSVQPQILFHLKSDGRRGFPLSDTRLGFSSFAVVKRCQRDLLYTTYRVATLPFSRSFLPHYLAADLTAFLDFPTLPNSRAVGAATLSSFLSTRTLSVRWDFQQLLVIKVNLLKLEYQQQFSLTPSELILLFFFRYSAVCYLPAGRSVSASVEFSSLKEVAQ